MGHNPAATMQRMAELETLYIWSPKSYDTRFSYSEVQWYHEVACRHRSFLLYLIPTNMKFFFTWSMLISKTSIQSINKQTKKMAGDRKGTWGWISYTFWQRPSYDRILPLCVRKAILKDLSSFLGPHCGSMNQNYNPVSITANFMFCFLKVPCWVQASIHGEIWPKCQICF